MRTFAADTSVPIAKTRGEIDELLRSWGCSKISWADEYDENRTQLQFVWVHDQQPYLARFALALSSPKAVRHTLEHKNHRPATDLTVANHVQQNNRALFRVMLLWLKGSLNAVRAGIVSAEAVFLPWLVGADGRTVADVAIPRMKDLLTGGADRLLTDGHP